MKQESNLENNCHDDHFTIWGYTAENTSFTPTHLRVIKSAPTWPSPTCTLLNTGGNVPMQGEKPMANLSIVHSRGCLIIN